MRKITFLFVTFLTMTLTGFAQDFGRAPEAFLKQLKRQNQQTEFTKSVNDYSPRAVAGNTSTGEFGDYNLNDGSFSPTGSIDSGDFPMAQEEGAGTTYRILNSRTFGTVNVDDGTFTSLGTISGTSYIPTGLAYDHTNNVMYLVALDGGAANLDGHVYTLDLTTLAVTHLGTTGSLIAFDMASDGMLYGPALVDDQLYKFDPTTNTSSIVGALGININYGQDVTYDPVADQLLTICIGGLSAYGYYDLTTGAFNQIAAGTGDQYAVFSITSACPAHYNTLSQDFEDADIYNNACWTSYTDGTDPGFIRTGNQFHGGAFSYYHNDDNTGYEMTSYMASPGVMVGDAAYKLKFWFRHNYYPTFYNYSGVWISTTGADPMTNPGDWTELTELTGSEDVWTESVHSLAAYNGQVVYFAFKYVGDYAHELYIDDVTVETSCPAPTDLMAGNITSDSADLSWTAAGSLFNIEMNVAGFTPTGTPTYAGVANPYSVSGLTPATSYDFYVQADCGGGDLSAWAGPYTFTTEMVCGIAFEDFEVGLPAGWSTVVNSGNCDFSFGSGDMPTGPDFPTNAAIFDDDACGSSGASSNVSLLSAVYDLQASGCTYATVGYDVAFQDYGGESFTVEVFDGTAWQVLAQYTTDLAAILTESFDVMPYLNSNFQVKFTFADNAGSWGWGAGVDNFCFNSDGSLGIANNIIDGFNMYPNPVNNTLSLKATNAIEAVSVYNMLGQEVMKAVPAATAVDMDMSQLTSGSYIVKVQSGTQIGSYSLIKN